MHASMPGNTWPTLACMCCGASTCTTVHADVHGKGAHRGPRLTESFGLRLMVPLDLQRHSRPSAEVGATANSVHCALRAGTCGTRPRMFPNAVRGTATHARACTERPIGEQVVHVLHTSARMCNMPALASVAVLVRSQLCIHPRSACAEGGASSGACGSVGEGGARGGRCVHLPLRRLILRIGKGVWAGA